MKYCGLLLLSGNRLAHVPAVVFWTIAWLLTHRREMHDDPVVFALRDRTSLFVGLLFCAVFWIAI
jgi:hypothetical protein